MFKIMRLTIGKYYLGIGYKWYAFLSVYNVHGLKSLRFFNICVVYGQVAQYKNHGRNLKGVSYDDYCD